MITDDLNPKKIATERIDILLGLAKKIVNENPSRAKRYVALAKKIGARHSIKFGERRLLFCKKCLLPLILGATARVRIAKNLSKVTTCLSCGFQNTRKIGQKKSLQNLNK